MLNRNQQISHRISTTSSVRDCAEVFAQVGESLGGGFTGMMNRMGAKKRNHTQTEGFYTPEDDGPFSAFEEQPDFAVGVNKLSDSVMYGAGYGMQSVERFVYDQQTERVVELVAYGGSRGASEKLIAPFVQAFGGA